MAGQAAEQRTIVAHGFSRGFRWRDDFSPGGGERTVCPWIFCRPVRGLNLSWTVNPRLAPWAIVCRAYGATVGRCCCTAGRFGRRGTTALPI